MRTEFIRRRTSRLVATTSATLLAVLAIGALPPTLRTAQTDSIAAARADGAVRLVVDLSKRSLTIRNGDESVEQFAVAIGRASMPTPIGSFQIRRIIWNPAWVPPDRGWAKGKEPQAPGAKQNPMRVVKIFFREPDYYIHGTNDTESIGSAASHGCLRMDPDDAYRVARYIMEHGGQPRDENWFWRVVHFRSETKTVYFDNPIPITIVE